jgi:hypothetical protein
VAKTTDRNAIQRVAERRSGLLKAVGLVAIVALLTVLVSGGFSGTRSEPAFPADGPAEFLYLDGARVLAYLAQFDGGTFTSEELSRKISDSQNGKVSVENALELGETSQQEQSLSRTITPTAAGNYIELLSKLEGNGLKTIGLRRFHRDVSGLTEGQFVTFRTHALSSPVYLNPYLAVRQRRTVSTLFPMPRKGEPGRARVRRQRAGARRFRDEVGKDPRVVFALRPEIEGKRGPHTARPPLGKARAEELSPRLRRAEERAERKLEADERIEYLMPMDAQLITKERSLIKFGGGEFTVVGKVVRIFPEHGDRHDPAYVDSPTLETWEQPLAHAPLMLLCRTDPRCAARLRSKRSTAAQRRRAIHHAREWAIEALTEQAEIAKRGAVIVPIAIYK